MKGRSRMPNYMYCVSCMANSDAFVAREIEKALPARALSLTYDREEHHGDKWVIRTCPLLWGYVFVYAEEALDIGSIYAIEHVARVLKYDDGEHDLRGDDRRFASWALLHDGHIALSKAILVGDKTRIIDGPLKNYEGKICKINRQKGRALVDVSVEGSIKQLWLYFEWMTLKDGQLIKLREN
jgi:transcription antitermination factor NusG